MKTLEKGSKYEKADTNGDGIVSDKELEIKLQILRCKTSEVFIIFCLFMILSLRKKQNYKNIS